MYRKLNQFMLLLVIVAIALTSAVRTTVVYADDGGTDPVTAETTPAPQGEGASPEEAPPAEGQAAAPETSVEEPATATTEVPAAEPAAAEEPVTVSEVLEQLPEDTALVVVNQAGEVEPLASTEAAEIVATGDPMWCPEGTTPGAANCTGSFGTFQALIAELANPANSYSGAGVIWVESTYNGADNNQIAFEGNVLTNLSGSNLTIRGGWSGGNNTNVDPATPSQLDVSLAITGWVGNITIQNINITSPTDNAGFGLSVFNTVNGGDVTLSNVSVSNVPVNTLDPVNSGDGAFIRTTGDVNVSNSSFNNNAAAGLDASTTGGDITLTAVTAADNGTNGAAVDTSGNVTVTGTNVFERNNLRGLSVLGGSASIDNVLSDNNGTGLNVDTTGNITLTNINAYANNMGGVLYTTRGAGTINVSNSFFGSGGAGNAAGVGNNWTGLHAESGGAITLNNVTASYNGANGGYIEAESYITVDNSTFNGNVNSNYPDDPGLRATSWNGSINLNNVTASGNLYGPGVALNVFDAHAITLIGGSFNQNGTFGIQAGSDDGNIELSGVIASYNQVKGAYLGAFWAGNIGIFNSTFVENGSYGIYAFTNEGNINLNIVTVLGSDGGVGPGADDLTDYGAILEAGGDVTVSNGTFQRNTDVGLGIISGGQVNLNNVVADRNGGNGVEVYSTTTAGPICEGESPVDIIVNVDGGAFTNNGGYGLMIKPGPGGTLTFINPSTFVPQNGLGDYLLDLSQEFKDCTCPPEPPKEEKPGDDDKGPLIVEVPATGGPTVAQDCDQYTATILKLPNGTWVKVGCPFKGFSNLEQVLKEGLPGPLGAGMDFAAAVAVSLTDADGKVILNESGTVTINFLIPEDSQAKRYSILFWDPTLNDGKGGWVELPPYEAGTSFRLHPNDPKDARTIVSGVQQKGNLVTATVNFSGMFVLVER